MRVPINLPFRRPLLDVALCVGLGALPPGVVGCSQPGSPRQEGAPAATAADRHDHDADHGHGHATGDHGHGAGPHGGTVADWGGGRYHVELTVDHDAKEAVVHVLGPDEKTPAPVELADGRLLLTIREPAFQIELGARPLAGETAAAASRYAGTHDSLAIVRAFAGTISGVVDGTPFAGDFVEEAHAVE